MIDLQLRNDAERNDLYCRPERMLIASVLIQAVRDLSSASASIRHDAMRFLASEDAQHYAEQLDLAGTLPQLALLLRASAADFGAIVMPKELRECAERERKRYAATNRAGEQFDESTSFQALSAGNA